MNPSISRSAFVLAIIAAACGRTSIHSVTCPPEAADDPLCRSADSDASDADVDPNAVTVTVEPLYAIASDWGSYALADGSPCAGGDGCVHGGELRRARISGVDGCDGLTARDALAAFEWTCDSHDGVAFYSSGLAADRGLRDLVTNAGFTSEVLIVERGGAPIAESEPAVWWSNAVVPLPSGVTLLDQPGAVYIAAAPTAGAYNIAADGIAIVSAPDAVVTFVGDGTDNCNETTGEVESANYACAIAFGGQRYLWLEADLDYSGVVRYGVLGVDSSYVRMLGMRVDANSSAVNAVALRNSEHARLSEIRIDNPGQYGLGLSAVTHSEFTDVAVVNSGLTALTLVDSNDNRLSGLRIYDATRIGLMLESSSRNVIMDTVVANIHTYEAAEGHGVHVRSGSRDNMLSRLFVASAGGIGVLSQGATAQPNTLLAVTIVNTASCGLHTVDGGESTLANIFIANAEAGICVGATSTITGNTQLTFANVAVSFAQDGVRLANAVDNRFTYALSIGNSTNLCEVGGASSSAPGLIDATCSDTGGDASSTYAGQASDATLYLRDYGASLSGNVAGSTATYASITDWSAVNTAWRFWGRDGAELSPAQRGACDAGATCRLFDAAVRASDTALRNVNGAFTAGAICPASVAGDVALEDASGNVFLINAIEDAGDGDGLCESAEACLFSPNIGAYQGAGSRTEPCVFADGRVSDVTLRAYATNGH